MAWRNPELAHKLPKNMLQIISSWRVVCSRRWFCLAGIVTLALLVCCGDGVAQTNKPMWDLSTLTNAPKWTALDRPKSPNVKAIFYTGVPFRGKPTRVFAYLGIPSLRPGKKRPEWC